MGELLNRGIDRVVIGDSVRFSKTVTETDIYMFAGISGDFHPVHVDEEYAKRTGQKGRIGHGVLTLGLCSTAGTMMDERFHAPTVSAGYDRIRFLKPVHVGDTITAEYKNAEIDRERNRLYAEVTCTNQNGELVMVGRHINKFLD